MVNLFLPDRFQSNINTTVISRFFLLFKGILSSCQFTMMMVIFIIPFKKWQWSIQLIFIKISEEDSIKS